MNSETFSIIQTLCRIGLGAENQAFRRQVERLRDLFVGEGSKTEASTLERLLKSASRSVGMQPSKVTVSPAFAGMQLSRQITAPVDRETGAPLAEIIFPGDGSLGFPILEPSLDRAIHSILEEWSHHELLRDAGVSPPMTCLFYGPPGTGKTHVALAMGAKLGLPIVLARLDGVISSFLGTTGRNIANLFAFANRHNCMLLLDEFDAIAKVRDDPHEVGEIKRVVNAILQNIDLRKDSGITIAITNHEQLLDSAVWRRFDVRIAIPKPSLEERSKIVSRYLGSLLKDEAELKFVAWLSDGMTGADIQVMANHLKRYRALRPDEPFLAALKNYSITQAGRGDIRHQNALLSTLPQLARNLSSSSEISLTQKEVGHVLSTSQAQVSRWLNDNQ